MFSRKGKQSRACSIILAPLSIEIDVSNNGLISRNFSTPYFFAKYKAVMIVAGCSHSAISILMGVDLSMYFKIKLASINCLLAVVGSASISRKFNFCTLTSLINFESLFKSVLTEALSVLISRVPLKAL